MGNSDDDSDFAEYGTALEAIEEDDAARKKPIPISDQIAVDERGRRRFHGAFTGGFSAGYFNSVGSKEGWTPSTFKSSRLDRGSQKSQNVLDFMDDEDKGAFGIAPQILRPTDDFADRNEARGRKRPWSKQADEGSIPGLPVLEQILQPTQETVGIKILIKMGWRPGKGVGPRIDKGAKRPKVSSPKTVSSEIDLPETIEAELSSKGNKLYGCSLPPEFMRQNEPDSDSSSDEIEGAKTLLAPDDVNSLLCNPKENTFGLGYKGLDRNTLTSSKNDMGLYGTKLKFRVENKNLSISGQAFGVGAFEENDDDIYSKEDMSQYDFALETPEERRRKKALEDKQKRQKKNKENCIEGFRASSTSSKLRRKTYPAPNLPPNFEPIHAGKKSRFETSKTDNEMQEASSKGLGRHSLSITERQVLIEDDVNKMTLLKKTEEPSPSENEGKATTSAQPSNTSFTKPVPPTQTEDDIKFRIERLKKFTQVLQAYKSETPEDVQKAAFKPFMKNPEKQERYEKYLTLRDAGFSECLKDLQPPEMIEWEREREKMEFERASKLYKPMSNILASRFTSAKSHDISHLQPEKEIIPEKDPKDDPKVAARMKLFGKLTHRVMEWHPDKLVCKRFNTPHPYPESKFVGVKGDPSAWGSKANQAIAATTATSFKPIEVPKKKSLFDNLDFSKPPPGLLPQRVPQDSSSSESPMECSEESMRTPPVHLLEFHKDLSGSQKVNPSEEEDLIVERPPLDLFKEIFADSSSDSDNEDTEPELTNLNNGKESQQFTSSHHTPPHEKTSVRADKHFDKVSSSSNNASNSLPPENESVNQQRGKERRGVFDRIDLDMLQDHAHRLQSSENSKSSRRTVDNSSSESDEDIKDAYGPAPPKSVSCTSTSRSHQSGSGSLSTKSLGSTPAPMYQKHQSKLDDTKKDVHTEEVIWVEKSALSDGGGSSKSHAKSKKHSSKKSRRKSNKKEKRKSHKSKKYKQKKKGRKHKSKSKRESSESSASGDDSASGSDTSSDSSVTINDSLDNRALLAKLKQITRSN